MVDETAPDVEITTRPFLGDLFAAPDLPAAPVASNTPGNQHLFAAATGGSPARLHLVRPDEPAELADTFPPAHTHNPAPISSGRRAATPTSADMPGLLDQVDWAVVNTITKQLSIRESDAERSRSDFDVAIASAGAETPFEEATLTEIRRLVERHAEWLVVNTGTDNVWSDERKDAHVQAVFDSAFRYGRLQPYLREPDVEDISIVGCDNVMVTKSNGIRERRPAIADSNDDLERMIADIATWRGRAFSRPNGHLDLDIGGARFSATGQSITSLPNVTIRKHNLVDVTLRDLINLKTITPVMAGFFDACANANLCVMAAGYPGAGKTTFLRAWMSAVPQDEKIVTIETERELYLNKLPHRHSQVQDLQYMPAMLSGSDLTAAYSLEDAFRESLRSSAQRILFGEIRGAEGPIAIKAMQAGKGSISTIHARSADDAIHRFADVLMSEQHLSDDTVPLRQIMRSIDLIIYLDTIVQPDGTRRRIVSQVAEIIPNDRQVPMAAELFAWDYDSETYVRPEKPSVQLQSVLRRVGYNIDLLTGGE